MSFVALSSAGGPPDVSNASACFVSMTADVLIVAPWLPMAPPSPVGKPVSEDMVFVCPGLWYESVCRKKVEFAR